MPTCSTSHTNIRMIYFTNSICHTKFSITIESVCTFRQQTVEGLLENGDVRENLWRDPPIMRLKSRGTRLKNCCHFERPCCFCSPSLPLCLLRVHTNETPPCHKLMEAFQNHDMLDCFSFAPLYSCNCEVSLYILIFMSVCKTCI